MNSWQTLIDIFQVTVPLLNPHEICQGTRKLVFVDPDDDKALFFWPALIIPLKDVERFKSHVSGAVDLPAPGEHLVSYFEDGSLYLFINLALLYPKTTSSPSPLYNHRIHLMRHRQIWLKDSLKTRVLY